MACAVGLSRNLETELSKEKIESVNNFNDTLDAIVRDKKAAQSAAEQALADSCKAAGDRQRALLKPIGDMLLQLEPKLKHACYIFNNLTNPDAGLGPAKSVTMRPRGSSGGTSAAQAPCACRITRIRRWQSRRSCRHSPT